MIGRKKLYYMLITGGLFLFILSGCVAPWKREYLADPIMQFDYFANEKAVKEHLLGAREGSSGGYGVGGGGCGCN
ncbi:MAG: DUF4266 domain-containing protein [Nitrospirota bacterium]